MIKIRYFMSMQTAYDMQTGYMLSTHELLTKREKERKCPSLKDSVFKEVHIPKEKTHWFFGVRLPNWDAKI